VGRRPDLLIWLAVALLILVLADIAYRLEQNAPVRMLLPPMSLS
jgi:hypothetical protein